MKITLENLLQGDYELPYNQWSNQDASTARPKHPITKVIIPEMFSSDVDALCMAIGAETLLPGTIIRLSLQEILKIAPRKRRRIESYNKLVEYLHTELNVSLILTSNKSKNYE